MKPHRWSRPVCIYEAMEAIVCRQCGATILLQLEGGVDKSCVQAGLPLDCDEAIPVVIHEEYDEWDGGFWMDEEPQWD